MCGIIGYVGHRVALPVLIDGLKRLEYRGYDSAGLALFENDDFEVRKTEGKVAVLERLVQSLKTDAPIGIAHTRWATHGEPNSINAHPHLDSRGDIVLVHNGIIENYSALKTFLSKKGHTFVSETDTEVLAHLIAHHYGNNDGSSLLDTLVEALLEVDGTYGLAIMSRNDPGKLYAARRGSPLLIGSGKNEYFVASDVSAVLRYTRDIIYLEDGEVAEVSADGITVKSSDNIEVPKKVQQISWDLDMIEKDGYEHFMLKEIHEQGNSLRTTMRGRLNHEEGTARLDGLIEYYDLLKKAPRIIITACGTSWHSALLGEYLIEEFAGIPVEVEYASEFRYRSPIINKNDPVFFISQSGETADTLGALRETRRKGGVALGICNVVGSTIARESDAGIYIHAGPEIGVASTKAFTSQVLVLTMLALMLGRMRQLSLDRGRQIVQALQRIPAMVEEVLSRDDEYRRIASTFLMHNNALYLGRGYNFPVALEGALKLKEISYIHAEGYPAAEMKHGPIALIDDEMPTIVIATRDAVYDKILSNIQEIRARNGRVLSICTKGDETLKTVSDEIIEVPEIPSFLTPIVNTIPMQLLAYHAAVQRGCNVDQPRNLAKSVTVE
jgi:glucosamine--fructose-6-phosphate aminotransferase (isomerizing)